MSYVALYRTWRPQDFDGLVGQEHIKTALTNAIESGKISHAYLFTGPRGTGKTSTARILAKALNCDEGPTAHPCNHCVHCREITEGTASDVIEIDAASNRGIDEIRKLRETVHFAPVSSRYKIYIIDEVHMITTDAFNALLKTLEEPPEHVVFVLATTEPQKIPMTIHSRCQRFDFHRVTVDDIAAHLGKVAKSSGIKADEDALRLMAIQADGGMRDAVGLLDQCSVMADTITAETVREVLGIAGRETMRRLVTEIGKENLPGALELLTALMDEGKDVKQIMTELLEYMRALLLYKADRSYQEIYLTDTEEALKSISPLFTNDRIMAATQRIHEASQELRFSVRGKITAELCLYDLCHVQGNSSAALAARIEALEKKVAALAFGVPVRTEMPAFTAPAAAPGGAPLARKENPSSPGPVSPAAVAAPAGPGKPEPTEKQATPPEPGTPDRSPEAPFVPTGDRMMGSRLWQGVMTGLKRMHKRTFLVFAEMAYVMDFDGRKLTLGVMSETARERMERNDFRDMILQVLKQGTGQDLELSILLSKEAPPAAEAPQPEETPPPEPPAEEPEPVQESKPEESPEELPESVKKAMQVFGGKLIKEE